MLHTPLRQFAFLRVQLNRLHAAHGLVEDSLKRSAADIDALYEAEMDALESTDPDDAESLEEHFAEQKAEMGLVYPQILRAALFAAAYGVLEYFLTSVCKHMELRSEGPKLRDLRGEGIQRARLYLLRVSGVVYPETVEWQQLTRYGKLRNLLVHSQGDLRDSEHRPAVEQLAREVGTFEIAPEDERVILAESHNPVFFATIERFAEQLGPAIGVQR